MSDQKPFYEIQVPKKETELVIRLVEISTLYEPDECMYRFSGNKRCHSRPVDQCEFCGLWMCATHLKYSIQIWIEDNSGFGNNGLSGYMAAPCEQCAKLPKEDMLKLRALKLEINR